MDGPETYLPRLQRFLAETRFLETGIVMTDLDGTAVHERDGRVLLSRTMELGLQQVHQRGLHVVVNTIRFPLSVMRVFGEEWRRITGSSLHVVSLNGSQIGRIVPAGDSLAFEEVAAFPLEPSEVNEVLDGVAGMVANGVDDLLVFFYPRDWRLGERIWAPDPARVEAVRDKYRSASEVLAGDIDTLREALLAQSLCMIFLLIDAPEDRRMAYQHTERSRFVTHAGVDKRHGGEAMARALGAELSMSLGAGDAETDTFLAAVGFAALVGNPDLGFKGLHDTVRLADPASFGELLLAVAEACS